MGGGGDGKGGRGDPMDNSANIHKEVKEIENWENATDTNEQEVTTVLQKFSTKGIKGPAQKLSPFPSTIQTQKTDHLSQFQNGYPKIPT